jgi:hypothetical protein
MKMRIMERAAQTLLLVATVFSSGQQPSSMEKEFQNPP